MPTFSDGILNVVFLRSGEKVVRIHTSRIVAVVANKHAFRNLAFVDLIRDSMCSNLEAVFENKTVAK